MAEQDCGCTVTTITVDGEPRDRVHLCPMHAAMKELRADLECVYSLTTQIKNAKPRDETNKKARRHAGH